MKNIHLLPTDKPSILHTWVNSRGLRAALYAKPQLELPNSGKNMYITSKENLTLEGYHFNSKYGDEPQKTEQRDIDSRKYWEEEDYYIFKIILTTDQDLIEDGVQEIDDAFLEWFVNSPSCEFVEYDKNYNRGNGKYYYKLIIPKEEQKQHIVDMMKDDEELGLYSEKRPLLHQGKVLTKEEVMEGRSSAYEFIDVYNELFWELIDKKAQENNTIDLNAYGNGVRDGVKWQNEHPKNLENLLDDNYDLNVQFHKLMRECIFSFVVPYYNETLPFIKWEEKYYGEYVEQPKNQAERMYDYMEEYAQYFADCKHLEVYSILSPKEWFEKYKKEFDLKN